MTNIIKSIYCLPILGILLTCPLTSHAQERPGLDAPVQSAVVDADRKVTFRVCAVEMLGKHKFDVAENIFDQSQFEAFANFENDLLKDLIPFIESKYFVRKDREARAIAGRSMGGGQLLDFGLANLDTFAWVGGFSSAPNTKPAKDFVNDPATSAKQLKSLWVSCGDADGLPGISNDFHQSLDEMSVPHPLQVDSGGHDFDVWRKDL